MEQAGAVNLMILAVAMALAAAIPALAPRLPLPRPVLEIALGAIVGPHILGLVHPDLIWDFLADFGLGMLFLMAGFEMDPALLRGRPIRNAAAGWAVSLILALVVVVFLLVGGVAQAPLLTALALCTTSIGLLLPVLRDASLLGPPYGPAVLAAGALGEGAPLFLLPLVLAHQGGAGLQALIMIGFGIAAAGAIVLASHAARGTFAAIIERTMGTSGQLPMRLAICLLILLVVLSQRFEIDLVLGAFVAGAVVRAALPDDLHDAMAARLDGIGSAFLVPVFFLSSGMRLDLAALMKEQAAAGMIAIYAMLMLLTRGTPALLLYDRELSPKQTLALALHSGTQLSLVVAIAGIASRRGLMPTGQAAALVAGAVLTVLLFPALAARILSEPAAKRAEQSDLPLRATPCDDAQCAVEKNAVTAEVVADVRRRRFWERGH